MIRKKLASALGSSLEWFDFALYGYLSKIISKVFFPATTNETLAIISTFTVFAVGFAARPIGALIFGYIGDRYGRIVALRLTPICITISTACMALLPSYNTAGNVAITLLIFTRFIQGICLGGEVVGNFIYLCESAPKQRYIWGSISSCSGSLGIILASLVASISYFVYSKHFFVTLGWRLDFLLSLPFGIITFFTRLKLNESVEYSEFIRKNNDQKNALFLQLIQNKKLILQSISLLLIHTTSFYFVFMFIPIFLTQIRMLPEAAILIHNVWYLALHMTFIPLAGYAVNQIGGKKSLIYNALGFMILSPALFSAIANGNINTIKLSLMIFSIITAINAAILPALLCEIIPVNIRYKVIALSFNVTFGVFGGLTPLLCLLLIKKHGTILLPVLYLLICSLVTMIIAHSVRTEGHDAKAWEI